MNEKNTTIRQSTVQNMAGEYNTTAPSPVGSVAVNAVNGVNATNAANPPDAVEAAVATAASPAVERRFQPLVPLKGQEGNLPPFPVGCLPSVVRDYVRAVAEHSQTSVDMAAVIGLGVLAVCLQGKYVVEGTPGYREPLSLYTVVIAPPGERKSSVMRDMTQFLYDYEREFNAGRQTEIRRNRQERESMERYISGLQEKLRHSSDNMLELKLQHMEAQLEEMPIVKPVRFFADDCSSEALTNLLANNDGVLSVISTEGGIFDIMAGRYNNRVNIDVWLKGHCGDAIRVDRLGRDPEYIPNPALSAILTIQPVVLDEIMSNATMAGRGLIARFLYASPPSMIGGRRFCTPEIPLKIRTIYKDMIYRLMAIPKPDKPAVVSDMTAFYVKGVYYELTLYMDLWNNELVAHALSAKRGDRMTYISGLTDLLEFKKRFPDQQLVLHSDQGSVYASKAFNELLPMYNVVRSMSRAGTPTDNAAMESINGWIKEELFTDLHVTGDGCVKDEIDDYVRFFNEERPAYALGYLTPVQYRRLYAGMP